MLQTPELKTFEDFEHITKEYDGSVDYSFVYIELLKFLRERENSKHL